MFLYYMPMGNRSLMLTLPELNLERLWSNIREAPRTVRWEWRLRLSCTLKKAGVRYGMPVLGVIRQLLNLWIHQVNNQGYRAFDFFNRLARRSRLRPKTCQELEDHLEKLAFRILIESGEVGYSYSVIYLKRYSVKILMVRQACLWVHH